LLSAKIAYRNLPKRRARTALTILAVVLGVALLVGINLATASATGEFTSYINKFWGRTDIVVSYGELPPVFDIADPNRGRTLRMGRSQPHAYRERQSIGRARL